MIDALSMSNVSKRYNDAFLFRNFNYTFTAGRYAIFGDNGSGKSTLLKMMAGIVQPDQGNIYFNRMSIVFGNNEFKQLLSYVPDTPLIYPFMSGKEFIRFVKHVKKVTDKKKIQHLLSIFNLVEQLALPFHKMSFGTQKKFLMVSAFMGDPKLIILDEPTIGLDGEACHALHEVFTSANIPFIVCSTHDQDFARHMSATCLTLTAPPHEDLSCLP